MKAGDAEQDLQLQGHHGGESSPKAQPKRRPSLARAASKKKDAATRVVHLNDGQPAGQFVGNGIKTAKYNFLTFLPFFLWEMFSRPAYFYFLIQARESHRGSSAAWHQYSHDCCYVVQ